MASFHGKSGTVNWDGAQAEVTNWTLDATVDMADSTAMGNANGYKSYLAGFKDWTATVEINVDDSGVLVGTTAAIAALGTSQSLALNDGNTTLTGTAFCVGFSPNVDANDVVKMTINFQGSGQIT